MTRSYFILTPIWPANHEPRGVALCFRALRIQPDNNGRRIQVAQVVFRSVNHVMAEILCRHAIAEHNRDIETRSKRRERIAAVRLG